MIPFLTCKRGTTKYRINPVNITFIEPVDVNHPELGCYINMIGSTVSVDETYRAISGRLNRLATNNTNTEANDESNED